MWLAKDTEGQWISFVCVITIKKNAPYLSVKVFSTKVLIGDTFLQLLLDMGLPVYVVIRATRRTSRLQCKDNTFTSQLF